MSSEKLQFSVEVTAPMLGPGTTVSIHLGEVEVYEQYFDQYEPGGVETLTRYAVNNFAMLLQRVIAAEDVKREY